MTRPPADIPLADRLRHWCDRLAEEGADEEILMRIQALAIVIEAWHIAKAGALKYPGSYTEVTLADGQINSLNTVLGGMPPPRTPCVLWDDVLSPSPLPPHARIVSYGVTSPNPPGDPPIPSPGPAAP